MNSRNTSGNDEQMKQSKQKICIENLQSDYFLEKIFEYINKNKSLEIIKPNKRLQKRLNLSIKNYKEYSQMYTSIEIEIKMADNRFGKFINIPPKE